jgi:hypothetical protein
VLLETCDPRAIIVTPARCHTSVTDESPHRERACKGGVAGNSKTAIVAATVLRHRVFVPMIDGRLDKLLSKAAIG